MKPLEGQQSLLGGPAVRYCRRCRRPLRTGRELGRLCAAIEAGRLIPYVLCAVCNRLLDGGGTPGEICPHCGNGSESKRPRARTVYVRFDQLTDTKGGARAEN